MSNSNWKYLIGILLAKLVQHIKLQANWPKNFETYKQIQRITTQTNINWIKFSKKKKIQNLLQSQIQIESTWLAFSSPSWSGSTRATAVMTRRRAKPQSRPIRSTLLRPSKTKLSFTTLGRAGTRAFDGDEWQGQQVMEDRESGRSL